MTDLTTLHDAWPAPEPPSPAARARARAALIEHAARGGFRRPAITPRRASLAAVALAIAAGVGVVASLGGTGPAAVPNASAQVLERAAHAVEQHPFTAPRDDQWIYTEDALTTRDGGRPQTVRRWHRADGGGFAMLDEHGRLQVETLARPDSRRKPGPLESYEALAALPTDPAALLRWAYQETESITGAGTTRDAEAYAILRGILGNGVLPPDLEAALFRAMKQIPGVTVSTGDVLGRPTLALALTDDWLRQELLLDGRTYAYRGQRSTIVKDATIDPLKAGNATGEVKRGSTVVAARVSAGIVDRPGERP